MRRAALLLGLVLGGCLDDHRFPDGPPPDADTGTDASTASDAGTGADASAAPATVGLEQLAGAQGHAVRRGS